MAQGAVRHLELLDDRVLKQPAAYAPEEVLACTLPGHNVADDALGEHAARTVVQVGELVRDLHVERHELRLARADGRLDVLRVAEGLGRLGGRELGVELNQLRVEAVHGLQQVGLAEFDVADARRLEDATAGILVDVHLHHLGVDRRVDDDPRTSAQLAVGRDVHEDRVLVRAQVVHDLRAELEHLAEHVARAARKATPVGEEHHGQVLGGVEVGERLRGLVGRVGEPDLARLREVGLAGRRVGGVGGDDGLGQASLNGDDAHRDAAQPGASDDDGLAPAGEVLGERALIEEAGLEGAVGAGGTREHHARIVWCVRGGPHNVAVDRVDARGGLLRFEGGARHVREPAQDLLDAVLVVGGELVCDAVRKHNLGAAELILRDVDLLAEQLVERRVAGQDERALLHLDHTLGEAVEVRADADRAASHVRKGEGFVIRLGGLARDHA